MPADMLTWLRAQIEERLAKAKKATPGPWKDYGGWVGDVSDLASLPNVQITDTLPEGAEDSAHNAHRANAAHIARHDPQDAIARCEAELAILGRYEDAFRLAAEWSGTPGDVNWAEHTAQVLADVVEDLATGYRHRPGWREDWRP